MYQVYKDEFPGYEEQPPLEPIKESFGVRERGPLRFEWSTMPPCPRVWFVKSGGQEVIQVQRDRFLHNWRKMDSGDEYPSYEVCRGLFQSSLGTFLRFIEEHQCGAWVRNQCELTYVNHVRADDGAWTQHGKIGAVVRAWRDLEDPVPETINIAMQYVIQGENREPLGRVHCSLKPKWRLPEHSPILECALTGRGKPLGPTIDGVLRFLDLGHEWERKVFLAVTSDAIQKAWGMSWSS
ncbi:MAG: hypothetical protein AB1758_04105 [Candidatus Eremiobacterota bacterium]